MKKDLKKSFEGLQRFDVKISRLYDKEFDEMWDKIEMLKAQRGKIIKAEAGKEKVGLNVKEYSRRYEEWLKYQKGGDQ